MCGIAGAAGAVAPLETMAERLSHRGPDGRTVWRSEGIGFAHARLSILDLEGGAQPFLSEDARVAAVYNGEIYNFRELRAKLEAKGHRFRSRTDGEVLVHLYEEAGDRFPERLRGMFAVALWDAPRRRLLLARDPLGVKPLVWMEREGALWFASEPKALGALWRPRLPAARLKTWLCHGYLPGEDLLGLKRLPPGHLLAWEGGKAALSRYGAPPAAKPEGDPVELLDRALSEAVRIRLVSDVPVGAFLSGGLDSSLVTALMRREGASELHTFSIAVPGAGTDESAWARQAAAALGTVHHERTVGPDLLDRLPEAMAFLDEPLADPAYLPNLELARFARERVKVCLSGDGGDEAFLGYRRYAWMAERGRGGPPFRGLWKGLGLRRWGSSPARRYADVLFLFSEEEAEALLAPGFRGGDSPADALEAAVGKAGLRDLQAYDYATYLACDILPKVDLSSMAASLEVRSPFLDREVLALAAALPVERLLGKALLKEAARRHLPSAIVDRPKQGFDLPLAEWLGKGRGHRLLRRLGGPDPFFDAEGVDALLERTASGDGRAAVQLYAVLAFLGWARAHAILAA